MDYRSLLAVPLAALALTANSADKLRVPDGWTFINGYHVPDGETHEAGVAPETESSGQRALTVKSKGKQSSGEISSISQSLVGYAGKRVRLTGQVKAAGIDGWGGLVVKSGFGTLAGAPLERDFDKAPPLGAAGCPDWCEVSVVAEYPADSAGAGVVTVGLALSGSGQVWARSLRLEVVGKDVPLTTLRFGTEKAIAARENHEELQRMVKDRPLSVPTIPPQNLSLQLQ